MLVRIVPKSASAVPCLSPSADEYITTAHDLRIAVGEEACVEGRCWRLQYYSP